MSKIYNRDVNLAAGSRLMKGSTVLIDADGNIDAPVTTTNLTTSGNTTLGDTSADTLTIPSTSQVNAPLTVGVDDTGYDVKLFGATAGAHLLWDESADSLKLVGGAATNMQGTLTVGVDDTGYDVTFFGATASKKMVWDESADKLIVTGDTDLDGTTTILSGGGIVSSVTNGIVPMIITGAADAVTDTAACSVANYYTTLTTTQAAVPTLADGSILGQMKKIQMIVYAVGDAVLTPANLNGGTTITFADVGDTAELVWDGTGWDVIALYNVVDGATAPVLA